MRKYLILAVALGFLGVFAFGVHEKEAQLERGARVILALAPVDPRSLMQGDYMALRYDLSRRAQDLLSDRADRENLPEPPRRGTLLVGVDADGMAHTLDLDSGGAPPAGSMRLAYVWRDFGPTFGADSFFFQEGHGNAYARARFAALVVDPDGTSLLKELLDENLQPIRVETGQKEPPQLE